MSPTNWGGAEWGAYGEGVSLPADYGSLGERCKLPKWCLAENAYVAYFEGTERSFCTYIPMLWVRQTVFHVTFGGNAEVWGQLPHPKVESPLWVFISRLRPHDSFIETIVENGIIYV